MVNKDEYKNIDDGDDDLQTTHAAHLFKQHAEVVSERHFLGESSAAAAATAAVTRSRQRRAN